MGTKRLSLGTNGLSTKDPWGTKRLVSTYENEDPLRKQKPLGKRKPSYENEDPIRQSFTETGNHKDVCNLFRRLVCVNSKGKIVRLSDTKDTLIVKKEDFFSSLDFVLCYFVSTGRKECAQKLRLGGYVA